MRLFLNLMTSLLCLAPLVAGAQVADLDLYRRLYPNKPFVYLYKTTSFDVQVKDKKPYVLRKYKEQRLFLTDMAKAYDTRKIATSAMIEVKNVKAWILVPNGKKYSRTEVTTISLKEEGSDENFYDGEKQYVIKFPSTLPGNILEIEYEEVYNEPRFFGALFLSDYFPVLQTTLNLRFNDAVRIDRRELNKQNLGSVRTATHKKNDSTLTWVFDTINPLPNESYSPDIRHYASFILLKIRDYTVEGEGSKPYLGNNDDLYRWYLELTKNLNRTPDPALKQLADSLTAGAPTELEKVKRIFYWVQDKIAYVAYEDGFGGYVPREASVTCKRRFGDCKDMATLIVHLCQTANLPVYPVWIGTRDIPYVFSEFSAPFCANHMIAAYRHDGEFTFLDATGKLVPFGVPTSMIQEKEGFIGISDKEYKLVRVPAMTAGHNGISDSVICSVSNGLVSGYGYLQATGYTKNNIERKLNNKTATELKSYMNALLNKGNNKFSVDTFAVTKNEREGNLVIWYKFTLPDYAVSSGKNTFMNLNFDKDYLRDLKTSNRLVPIEFEFGSVRRLHVTLNLNKGEKVEFLPANTTDASDVASFSTRYADTGSSIVFHNEVTLPKMYIESGDFQKLNKVVDSYNKATNKSVSLLRTNH